MTSMIIKVKISHADYVENTTVRVSAKAILQQVKHKIYRWFQLSHSEGDLNFPKIPAQVKYPSVSYNFN